MLCAIAEIESDRQLLATRYNKKSKEITMGIMQILPKTADWLVRYLSFFSLLEILGYYSDVSMLPKTADMSSFLIEVSLSYNLFQ